MKIESNQKLIHYLQQVPGNRIFLKFQEQSYTYAKIIELSNQFRNNFPELINKNCSVVSEDRESLAIYLPSLNNICGSIFLQPNDISGQELDFYKAGDIDYIVRLSHGSVICVEEAPKSHDTANKSAHGLLLATSGTTGIPKLASYSLGALIATTQKNIERGQDFIWGLSYDINRFAGIQVYLQAIAAGSTLVITPRHYSIESQVQFYVNNNVNCISATPSFWRKVLMVPFHKNMPLNRITLGGEISNQSIISALLKSFPDSSIVHIYASTEAGVGFAVKDNKEGFPAEFLTDSSKLTCELKIKNGLLWIKSPHGCSKFVKGQLEFDSDGFINTGDLVEIKEERVLFLGRESGSINVGGNKVMPEKVESVLESSSLVKMARVFAKTNPVLGALVFVEIITTEQGNALSNKELKTKLINFCRTKLESFEIPALFKRVEVIVTNTSGKKIRNKK